jgi:chitin disaccharide deacetylase
MVRWAAAEEAALYARAHPRLSVGLHIDLSEWTAREGDWSPVYERVPDGDPEAVGAEIEGQLARFRELVGADPTHLDGHQHVHRDEPAKSILIELAADVGVPLRNFSPRVRYSGSFYGQTARGDPLPSAISVDGLLAILSELPPGITELGCHPAVTEDLDSMYLGERLAEVRTLCDPRIAQRLAAAEIVLLSFAELE